MDASENIQAVARHFEDAGVKSVFGDPVRVGGRAVIPVARIAYGFGGGFGPAPRKPGSGSNEGERGTGGGGGGSLWARPAGVIEVTEDGTRFIGFGRWRWAAAGLLAGIAAGLLASRAFKSAIKPGV